MIRRLLLLLALLWAVPAAAQDFPALTGRVVDQAELLSPEQEAALTAKLAALEQQSSRQLVVATIASLQDRAIEDYGIGLARHWQIGQGEANNGVLLIVAPNERKVRLEVGYGLEGIIPDGFAGSIIRERITPRFRENDYPGGIDAGVDAIVAQLQAPPEVAEQRVIEARERSQGSDTGWVGPAIFWGFILLCIVVPWIVGRFRGHRGRSYRRRGGGLVDVLIWDAILNSGRRGSGGGGSWGGFGGGSGGGGGFGGFSGGGGSFGGGGASGSW